MRILSLISFVILFAFKIYAQQYQIPASVFGNGGNSISDSNFRINSTVGQTLIGGTGSNNFIVYAGFWKPEQMLTPVEEVQDIVPREYRLEQNYPNPFNPSTIIEYQIPEESGVTLKIYDILGREVKVLVNEENSVGNYKINFNASNLSSGIYFYRLDAKTKASNKQFSKVGKMMLLK